MHEVSLVIGLARQLERICEEHGAQRVTRFELEIGAMSNVVPKLLEDAIEVVSEDVDLIRDAEVVVHEVQLELHCRDCGAITHPESFTFGCPACGSTAVKAVKGEELLLRNVELEIDDLKDEDRDGPSMPSA
jgi:hydrogenase nickel incorporation protein HypA/HybF